MASETTTPLTSTVWRKSSRSGDQGACVEFALLAGSAARTDDVVGIRDSKDSTGPILRFSPAAWTAFTTALPASPILP